MNMVCELQWALRLCTTVLVSGREASDVSVTQYWRCFWRPQPLPKAAVLAGLPDWRPAVDTARVSRLHTAYSTAKRKGGLYKSQYTLLLLTDTAFIYKVFSSIWRPSASFQKHVQNRPTEIVLSSTCSVLGYGAPLVSIQRARWRR
jgi:hypothetical protein